MTKSDFGGPEAVRMVLDKIPADPDAASAAGWAGLVHLRGATVADLARHRFTQDEIDAITDLMMEHFDVGGFVADTVIDHLSAQRVTR